MGHRPLTFDAFFAAEWDGVVRALTVALRERPLAEDAAQTAFERAYARWSRVSGYERPATWVYVVAMREALRRRPPVTTSPVPAEPVTEDPATSVASTMWLSAMFDRLPTRQREAVVLRHVAGLSLEQIASAQRVTVGTVKASLHAAHRSLRPMTTEREEITDGT